MAFTQQKTKSDFENIEIKSIDRKNKIMNLFNLHPYHSHIIHLMNNTEQRTLDIRNREFHEMKHFPMRNNSILVVTTAQKMKTSDLNQNIDLTCSFLVMNKKLPLTHR